MIVEWTNPYTCTGRCSCCSKRESLGREWGKMCLGSQLMKSVTTGSATWSLWSGGGGCGSVRCTLCSTSTTYPLRWDNNISHYYNYWTPQSFKHMFRTYYSRSLHIRPLFIRCPLYSATSWKSKQLVFHCSQTIRHRGINIIVF